MLEFRKFEIERPVGSQIARRIGKKERKIAIKHLRLAHRSGCFGENARFCLDFRASGGCFV